REGNVVVRVAPGALAGLGVDPRELGLERVGELADVVVLPEPGQRRGLLLVQLAGRPVEVAGERDQLSVGERLLAVEPMYREKDVVGDVHALLAQLDAGALGARVPEPGVLAAVERDGARARLP